MDEQVGGVHCLPLDAVRAAGVGASVLPTDRRHRQAALTHLEPSRWTQLPLWAPLMPSQVEGASGPVHRYRPVTLPPPAPPAPPQW